MKGKIKNKASVNKPSVEETYRMLQMQLDLGCMKVLAFTSVEYCEEKSEYIGNIAKSMVLEGMKVLVIDCNMDNPKIKRFFGVELKDLLEEPTLQKCGITIFEVPKMPRLNFIPQGYGLRYKDGKLDFNRITEVLEKARDYYDIILIDSPPAGIVMEGVKLSVLADGTIIVILSDKTQKDSAKKLKEMLDSMNVKVLGIILGT